MALFAKGKRLLFQEPENKNKSAKSAVVQRVSCLAFMLYLLFLGISAVFVGSLPGVGFSALFLLMYAFAFLCTYRDRMRTAFLIFNVSTAVWVIALFVLFGETTGALHFLFALTLVDLLLERKNPVFAITALYALRVFLYVYGLWNQPLVPDRYVLAKVMYTLSLVLEYGTVLFSGIYFTKDAFQMEGRLQEYNEELRHAASTDSLTKVWNRFRMLEHVNKQLKKYKRGDMQFMSVAIGDIDFFKRVNDTYGHECGDEVLRRLAGLFDEKMHAFGAVARWGGEEFLFLFENMNGDEAWTVLSDIQRRLNQMEIPYGEHMLCVTMTFGLAEYDFNRSVDENIKLADDKLYRGKEGGRDRIVY